MVTSLLTMMVILAIVVFLVVLKRKPQPGHYQVLQQDIYYLVKAVYQKLRNLNLFIFLKKLKKVSYL